MWIYDSWIGSDRIGSMIIRWSHSIGIQINAITVSLNGDKMEYRRQHLHKKRTLNAERWTTPLCVVAMFDNYFSSSLFSFSFYIYFYLFYTCHTCSYFVFGNVTIQISKFFETQVDSMAKLLSKQLYFYFIIFFLWFLPEYVAPVRFHMNQTSFTIRIDRWKSHIIVYSKSNCLFWKMIMRKI